MKTRHAIVLCGGQSKRMGSPKALLEVGGIPMLSRVCSTLVGIVSELIVVSSPGQKLPQLPDETVVLKDAVAHAGPLSGLSRGYEALMDRTGYTFLCGCDYPFLTQGFLLGLLGQITGLEDVISVASDRPQPLCAWYRTETLGISTDLLADGENRLSQLLDNLVLHEVSADELACVDVERANFRVNTPEEHLKAEEMGREL